MRSSAILPREAAVKLPKGVWFQPKTLSTGKLVRYGYFGRGPGSVKLGREGSAEFYKNLAEAVSHKPAGGDVRSLVLQYRGSLKFRAKADRTRLDYERQLEKIVESFGGLSFAAIAHPNIKRHIRAWHESMAASPRQADYAMQVLNILLAWGVDENLLAKNHAAGFTKLYSGDRSEMTWTSEQVDVFLAVAPKPMQQAMILAVETGQRQADLLRMRWDQIDGDVITLRQRKGNVIASVPISPRLRAMLDDCARTSDTILTHSGSKSWAASGNSFRTAWSEACDLAGVRDLTFHDLRGTFVTRCFELGWTREEIAFCTGHSLRSLATLEKYANRQSISRTNARRLAERMKQENNDEVCKLVCKPDEVVL